MPTQSHGELKGQDLSPNEIKCVTEGVGERVRESSSDSNSRKHCIDRSLDKWWLLAVRVKHEKREEVEEKEGAKGGRQKQKW